MRLQVVDWGDFQQRRLVDSQGCCKYAGVASSFYSQLGPVHLWEGINEGSCRELDDVVEEIMLGMRLSTSREIYLQRPCLDKDLGVAESDIERKY